MTKISLKRRLVEKMKTYVAVDIGASSGRLMLAQPTADGRLTLEEVHRFTNGFKLKDGHDRWDIDHLIHEILVGLTKVKARGINAIELGIDTWAVDYVLVGFDGQNLEDPISYRDRRTSQAITELTSELP